MGPHFNLPGMIMTVRGILVTASLMLLGLLVTVPAQAETLTYLAGRLDDAELAELKQLAPNVEFLVGLTEEQALARAAEIDAADAHVLTAEFLAAADNLRWVQSWSAGVDSYLEVEGLRDNDRIVMTNMQGVHGPAIAEHVMASLLSLTRKMPQLHAAQREGRWDRQATGGSTTLSGRTMFVVGMGGIGSQVARRAHAFDMKILATVRNPAKKEKPAYVDRMGGADDLDAFLAESEVVVVALPLTDETRGLFDAEAFARMPAGSWFVNIGRGPIVDTEALVAALASGHLAGAALDVLPVEPPPAGYPIFQHPSVQLSPHVAFYSQESNEEARRISIENIIAWAQNGRPLHVVVESKR